MVKVRLGLVVALLFGLFSVRAAAQSVISLVDVARKLPHGQLESYQINAADCLADDSIIMTLQQDDYQGLALEIWAGNGCDALVNRVSATATCWPLYSARATSIVQTASFRVRELLAGRTQARSDTVGELPAGSAECQSASDATSTQSVSAYVMLIDANYSVQGEVFWKAQYRLASLPPPNRVSVLGADRQLLVDFAYDSLGWDSQPKGAQFFCDPPPGDPGAVNAAVTTSDAGELDVVCNESNALIPGQPGASLQHLRCGSAIADTFRGTADGLVNGIPYNLAVATVDEFENVGPLSAPSCGIPQAKPAPEASIRACSFAGTGSAQSGSALGLLIAIGAALARRSRRG